MLSEGGRCIMGCCITAFVLKASHSPEAALRLHSLETNATDSHRLHVKCMFPASYTEIPRREFIYFFMVK